MKKYISILAMAAALLSLASCKGGTIEVDALVASFDISANPCYAGDEIHFISTSTGGKKPYECVWTVDDTELPKHEEEVKFTFKTNGTYTVVLKVTDDLGNTASKRKLVVVDPAPIENKGTLNVVWAGRMEGYNSISTPAVDNDGNVYCTSRANYLYKWDKTGKEVWKKPIFKASASGSVTYGSPSVDTDGTIFIGGGTTGPDGSFVAFNPDGSVKWSFSEWYNANGGVPSPGYQASVGGIDGDNVYFGCVGTSGIAVSANKTTGKRNGFCQPAGGCRTGLLITNDGYVSWYGGNYGLWGIAKSTLDNGGADKVNAKWGLWSKNTEPTYAAATPMGGIAAFNLNGKPHICGTVTDSKGTRVYAVEAESGKAVAMHYVTDTGAKQDQGGVCVTKEGYIVAALAFSTGSDDGGIVVIDPSTADATGTCNVIGRFKVQEKVAGSPAVDAAGNIHFGTESGQYYVLDKNFNLILKASIADAVTAFDSKNFEGLDVAKIWSSIVIGDDGTVYVAFTESVNRLFGGVVAFQPTNNSGTKFCTGPADSDWPMFAHDRRHTNKQN